MIEIATVTVDRIVDGGELRIVEDWTRHRSNDVPERPRVAANANTRVIQTGTYVIPWRATWAAVWSRTGAGDRIIGCVISGAWAWHEIGYVTAVKSPVVAAVSASGSRSGRSSMTLLA